MSTHIKRMAAAVVVMICGTAGVFGLLLLMNAYSKAPDREEQPRTVEFTPAPKPKPPRPKHEHRRPRRKTTTKRPSAPPPPVPQLASSLSSVSLGLPAADVDVTDHAPDELLGDVKTSVMTQDAVDHAPKPIRRTAAPYPARARAKGITGWVKLNLLVDERGNVERVKVLGAKPAGVFEDAAKQTVRGWQFEVPTYEGKPVKTWVTQTVRFELT